MKRLLMLDADAHRALKCKALYTKLITSLLFNLLFVFASAQQKVAGTVKAGDSVLAGVTVILKGTIQSTLTNDAGRFSIAATANGTLVFSHVGYADLEVKINGRAEISVQLGASVARKLDDVVVVAYGTQKRSAVTSAVSTIKASDIAQKPVVNVTNSLVGRASGLIVTQGSGEPGFDGSSIQIRGAGSTGSTQPLYIVDGVPRDFSRLDPNTIASFSILKDAAAVAPYGVAGANGVILVTTKQGKSGKPVLTFDAYAGYQNPTFLPKFVSSYQYALMRNEAAQNDDPNDPNLVIPFNPTVIQKYLDQSDPNAYPNSQPLRQIIKPNTLINYENVSISGGTDVVKYFASVGYTHQDGMWSTTFLNRYNGSFNLTVKATQSTTVGLSASSSVEDQHFPTFGASAILDQAERTPPTSAVYFTNGLWGSYVAQSLVGEIYHSGYQLNQNTTLFSSLLIEQKLPVKGLSLKGVINYDSGPDALFTNNNYTGTVRKWTTPIPFYSISSTTPTPPYTYVEGIQGSTSPIFMESYSQNITLTYQGMLNYSGSFGKSDVAGLVVVEDKNVNYKTFNAARTNYPLNIDELNFGGSAPSDASNSGSSSGEKQIGYVYKLDYSYDKKYIFQAAGRYDGSYLFAPGHRFGFFPAFAAGWLLSKENFIKDNFNWINYLKLRGTWGKSGAYPASGNTIQTYQYLNQYQVNTGSAVIGGSPTLGVSESLQGNPFISWEKADKTDIGLEASLWNGLLGIEADYFFEKRANMLVSIAGVLPLEYGVGVGYSNGGVMQNHGVDITLTTAKRFSNDLRLDLRGTFTFARNKLLQIFESGATYNNPNRRQTGRPLNTQFGLKALGYFAPSDFVDPSVQNPTLKPGIPVPQFGPVRPGDIRYEDLSGPNGKSDGIIDNNDITDIGHPGTPEIIFGLNPRLTYKHFDLDVLLQGATNSNLQLNGFFAWPFNQSGSPTELSYSNHWTPEHTNALYPRLSSTPTSNNTQASSWFQRNDTYIRVKSCELGYTFSDKLVGHAFHSLRVYVAAENLFTWTPYIKETIDPENSGSNMNYFQQRVISAGVNASF
jgi:TonB-linked SusC/RagA family outer membrane protein